MGSIELWESQRRRSNLKSSGSFVLQNKNKESYFCRQRRHTEGELIKNNIHLLKRFIWSYNFYVPFLDLICLFVCRICYIVYLCVYMFLFYFVLYFISIFNHYDLFMFITFILLYLLLICLYCYYYFVRVYIILILICIGSRWNHCFWPMCRLN